MVLSGGGLAGAVTVALTLGSASNIKLDIVNGAELRTSASAVVFGPVSSIVGLGVQGLSLTATGAGDRRVDGSGGGDSLTGQGNDQVFGDDGDDPHVNGNLGDDLVYGATGNDTVFGGQGADTLYGEDGNDWLSGDLGNDVLTGGAGADRFLIRPPALSMVETKSCCWVMPASPLDLHVHRPPASVRALQHPPVGGGGAGGLGPRDPPRLRRYTGRQTRRPRRGQERGETGTDEPPTL